MLTDRINKASDGGFQNVITFSGYRRGLSTEEGMKNMVDGLKKIVGHAEKKKVNLVHRNAEFARQREHERAIPITSATAWT